MVMSLMALWGGTSEQRTNNPPVESIGLLPDETSDTGIEIYVDEIESIYLKRRRET